MGLTLETCDCCGEALTEYHPFMYCKEEHQICITCQETYGITENTLNGDLIPEDKCPCCVQHNKRKKAYDEIVDAIEWQLDESIVSEILENLNYLYKN